MAAAFSSVPPFLRYAVMPVARKLRLPMRVLIPADAARRRTMACALACGNGVQCSQSADFYGREASPFNTGTDFRTGETAGFNRILGNRWNRVNNPISA